MMSASEVNTTSNLLVLMIELLRIKTRYNYDVALSGIDTNGEGKAACFPYGFSKLSNAPVVGCVAA
jgi:hypothetical protein